MLRLLDLPNVLSWDGILGWHSSILQVMALKTLGVLGHQAMRDERQASNLD